MANEAELYVEQLRIFELKDVGNPQYVIVIAKRARSWWRRLLPPKDATVVSPVLHCVRVACNRAEQKVPLETLIIINAPALPAGG